LVSGSISPVFTADPTQVADDFYNSGFDVVVSGIGENDGSADRSEEDGRIGQRSLGDPYDYQDACAELPKSAWAFRTSTGVPTYVKALQSVQDGSYASFFENSAPIGRISTTPIRL
jgi:simple sugar transport system substrate-binding protein